jgi:predicted alpha/beta hydrolase family esterase
LCLLRQIICPDLKKIKTPFLLRFIRWLFPKLEKIAPLLADRLFVKIFFTPLQYPIPEKEKSVLDDADRFTVKSSSKIIQCYRWGSGPIILLVHGWAGRPTQFRKFIETLTANRFQVVGFDGPAHGMSDGRTTNIKEFNTALLEIVKVAGTPEAIITHSFGGAAVLYALTQGLTVDKLINIATPTIGDEIIKTYLRAINGSWKTGEKFKSYVLKTEGQPFDSFTALNLIRRIERPPRILLIHDEDDEDVYISHAEAFCRIFPEAKLYRTKGLGHTRILKDDGAISESVTFIRELRLR